MGRQLARVRIEDEEKFVGRRGEFESSKRESVSAAAFASLPNLHLLLRNLVEHRPIGDNLGQ